MIIATENFYFADHWSTETKFYHSKSVKCRTGKVQNIATGKARGSNLPTYVRILSLQSEYFGIDGRGINYKG